MSQENVEVARRFHEHFDLTGEPLWEVVDNQPQALQAAGLSKQAPR
jgi:hypothetical protein